METGSRRFTPTNGHNQTRGHLQNQSSPARSSGTPTQILLEVRRQLAALTSTVDSALQDLGVDQAPRQGMGQVPIPVSQTYPEGYDLRNNPEGLRAAILKLRDRVNVVDEMSSEFSNQDLFDELKLRTAEARTYQLQCESGSAEWETVVQAVKTLTRIVCDERPGFVYGLATNHNTDWGEIIRTVTESYSPLEL